MASSRPISRLLAHPTESAESIESVALLVGAALFALSAGAALIAFGGAPVNISGPGSIGQLVALVSAVASVVIVVGARYLLAAEISRGGGTRGLEIGGARIHWFDVAALALAHGVIVLLLWLAVADTLARSFTGAVLYPLPAVALAATAVGATGYAVFLFAARMTPLSISLLLGAFLVSGTFASMLSASDPLWWQKNLSTLGISDDASALSFNITLIVAGVIVTTIAHCATAVIPAADEKAIRGRRRLRVGLVIMGVMLACVGIFPVDRFLTAHNVSATGMAVVFVVLVLMLPGLVPAIPRVFVLFGYAAVAVIVVLAVLFATGRYNLTAVELVAFLLVFGWLIVLLRNTAAMHPAPVDETAAASR